METVDELPLGTSIVRMEIVLTISKDEFDNTKQLDFRQGIADAAGVILSKVRIVKIESTETRRRHLLADQIKIEVEVSTRDSDEAKSVANMLTEDSINAQLQKRGLPEAVVVSDPRIESSDPDSAAADADKSNLIIIVTVCSTTLIIVVVAVFWVRKSWARKAPWGRNLESLGSNSLQPGNQESHVSGSQMPQPHYGRGDIVDTQAQITGQANALRARNEAPPSTVVNVEDDLTSSILFHSERLLEPSLERREIDLAASSQSAKSRIAKRIQDLKREGILVNIQTATVDAQVGFIEVASTAAARGIDKTDRTSAAPSKAVSQPAGLIEYTQQDSPAAPLQKPALKDPSQGRALVKQMYAAMGACESSCSDSEDDVAGSRC